MVRLRPPRLEDVQPGPRHRFLRPRPALQQHLLDSLGRELHRHDLQEPRARDVDQPDAAVLLRLPGGVLRPSLRAARSVGCADPSRARPAAGVPLLRRVARRRHHPLAEPLLDLRHPEVYVIILPAFGIATSIIPTFVRRRMVAFPLVALAELLVAFIGFGVWAHHMFAVGLSTVTTVYFAAASLIIVIPSGIQLFAWITTIVTGTPRFKTPLLWIIGFIVLFMLGGLSGIMFAAIPFDQQLTDTYFVVAHFHYVIFGAAVFPLLGGMFYWFPKVTGRMYHEGWGQASFWLTFVGMNLTFFPMHILGLEGMPRREYTYPPNLGWTGLNLLETIGAYLLALGLLAVAVNLVVSRFRGERGGNDPWGGDPLEWSTTSPPPAYNYAVIPRVTSPYAMWDRDDREADIRDLERGERTLERGHETPASTVVDADWDEILDMPSSSPWPPVLALAISGVFAFALLQLWIASGIFVLASMAVLLAWH